MKQIFIFRAQNGVVYYQDGNQTIQATFFQDAYHIPFPQGVQVINRTSEQWLKLQ